MGNNFGKKFSQFQVGKMESKRQMSNLYLLAGFIIIIASVFVYLSFIPTLPISCYINNEKKTADSVCNNPNKDQKKCDDAYDILAKKNKKCSIKTKNKSFLVGSALLIFLAICIIFYANRRNNFTHRNYLSAITQGDDFELDATSKVLARVL